MFGKRPLAAAGVLLASTAISHAQTVQTLANQMPEIPIYGFLMTDGTALVQGSNQVLTLNGVTYGTASGSLNHWFALTPDKTGSYLNGTWSQVADAFALEERGSTLVRVPYEPEAGGGGVLADGRLALIGGEYTGNNFTFTLTNEASVYSPFTNHWTPVTPPLAFQPGQGGFRNFGDSTTTVLPGGNLLVGQKITKRAVALDPESLTWIQYGELMTSKNDFNAEEGWTLLPDGSILTVDVAADPKSERLIPSDRPAGYHWINQGKTPGDLASPRDACCIPFDHGRRIYNPPGEIGPAILRPDGTVFATGSINDGIPARAGHTDIYTPTGPTTGVWTAGPDFPKGENAGDNFGILEPNGNVLVEGDSAFAVDTAQVPALIAKRRMAAQAPRGQAYPSVHLYEWDGTHLTQLSVAVELGATLLPLPSGQVLAMGYNAQLFTPADTSFNPAWAPTITKSPTSITAGSTYKIFGTQFNGLSQACSYGDEFQCATNYPLVRITNTATGDVIYARTHNHSTMAVATGSREVSTFFDVPAGIETGPSSLSVVANGIPSVPVSVTVN